VGWIKIDSDLRVKAMTKVRTGTLLAVVLSAAILIITLVRATPLPTARAADVNTCAGTMQEVSNNINANPVASQLFPYVGVNDHTGESAGAGTSAEVGTAVVKITAPKNVKAGDQFVIDGQWRKYHNYYSRNSTYPIYEPGTKNVLAYVSMKENKLHITWSSYAASRTDTWVNLTIFQAFSFNTTFGDDISVGTKYARFQLLGCDGYKGKLVNKPVRVQPPTETINASDWVDNNGKVSGSRITMFTMPASAYGIRNVNNRMRVLVKLGKGWNFDCAKLPEETDASYYWGTNSWSTFKHAEIQKTPGALVDARSRKVRPYCLGGDPKVGMFEFAPATLKDQFYIAAYVVGDGSATTQMPKSGGKRYVRIDAEVWEIGPNTWRRAHNMWGRNIPEYINPNTGGSATPPKGEITVTKKGNGLDAGQTFAPGTNVDFTYQVTNTGKVPVDAIRVTDSKNVDVTCPKALLKPGESMICTGTGQVVGSPGIIAPPNPGSGDVSDPSGLD